MILEVLGLAWPCRRGKHLSTPCSWVCQPSEVVLRGGYLKQPVLLTRLVTVDDKKFVYLWKGCPELSKFLTGLPVCKRPLASCLVFEKLAEKRNAAYCQKLVELKGNSPEASGPDNEGMRKGSNV